MGGRCPGAVEKARQSRAGAIPVREIRRHRFADGMSTRRLFVALVPPVTVRAELAALAAPIADTRWVPEENLHLTLRFIGETDEPGRAAFEASLATVRVEPFILPVGGTGVFPTRGPAKVVWAGVGRGHTRLFQLRKQVDEALLTVDTRIAMPSFHPHFTLGRLGEEYRPREIAAFLARHAAFEAPPFRVAEFHLLASELRLGAPPRYEVVRTFPLRPREK
jgi:2'-5' RNA ligase